DAAIAPDEGAYAFQTLLRHNRTYTGYAPIIGAPWVTAFAERSKFAEAFKALEQGRSGSSKFRSELDALPLDEWPGQLRRMVAEQVSLILRRTIDPDRQLSEYGLDSLGNLELRTRVQSETGIRISSTDITTVRGLADHLFAQLAPEEAAASSQ
ncbi:acyl carrier protein, partial [Mycobacterium marinum]